MTKREFAEGIAEILGAEVKEVEKTNGIVRTGILKKNDTNIAPTVYIDEYYENGVSIGDAAKEVSKLLEQNSSYADFDRKQFEDWNIVEHNLRARLYNKATKAEVKVSAAEYGFEDLVIVPVVNVVVPGNENGSSSVKVNNGLLKYWGKTAEEVIDIAMKNSESETEIKDMKEILVEMGIPEEVAEAEVSMTVITNKLRFFGAIQIICAREKLKEMFPNGYTVLPSSVHEVIVVEIEDNGEFDNMVQAVNDEQVNPEEQLSNRSYKIN